MTSVIDIETPTELSALDDDAFGDGKAANAHVLRTLARNTNHMHNRPTPLLIQCWDGSTDGNDNSGKLKGSAGVGWENVTYGPFLVRKPPQCTQADVHVYYISDDGVIWMQCTTLAVPFREAAVGSDDNVGILTATASVYSRTSFTIDMQPGPYELLNFYIQGGPLDTTDYDPTSYDSPASGAIEAVTDRLVVASTTSWTLTKDGGAWDEGGFGVQLEDSTGTPIAECRKIVSVIDFLYNNTGSIALGSALLVDPPYDSDVSRVSAGGTYNIYKLPDYEIASISVFSS